MDSGRSAEIAMTDAEFRMIAEFLRASCGLHFGPESRYLLERRLSRRCAELGLRSFTSYHYALRNDPTGEGEVAWAIDHLTTNETYFLRERRQLDALIGEIVPSLRARAGGAGAGPISIWSAGCSSGEEPYSIAMTVDDTLAPLAGYDWKLLATDVSTKVLAKAREGLFEPHRLGTVPESFRRRYFVRAARDAACVQVRPELRQRICFSRLNLMDEQFPFRHGFDFIFCRNVMIYFDRETQTRLVAKFARHLRPLGHLLIGHSESLNNIDHPLTYVRPTIYRRGPT